MSPASTPSGTALTLTSVFGALFLPKNAPRKMRLSKSSLTNLQLPFYRGKKVLNLFKNRTLSSHPTRSNGKLHPVHQTGSAPLGQRTVPLHAPQRQDTSTKVDNLLTKIYQVLVINALSDNGMIRPAKGFSGSGPTARSSPLRARVSISTYPDSTEHVYRSFSTTSAPFTPMTMYA